MSERTIAQSAAAENWAFFKSQVRYWRSWKYTPSSHPRAYAMWVADMRNAWVAYHAGAEWMTGTSWGVAEVAVAEAARLRAELGRVLVQREKWAENAEAHDNEQHAERERLTAEVERWRVKADDLRKLVSAKRIEAERLQGQLAEARAEVQRLRSASREYRRDLATCRDRATSPVFCEAYDWCIGRLDALTREDGEE